MEKLFEGSYAHSVGAVGKAYDDFFIKRSSMRVPEEIPPSLSYLFHLMVVCKNTDHSLFSNGAGKVFLAESRGFRSSAQHSLTGVGSRW